MAIARVQTATVNLTGGTTATTAAITVGAGNLLIGDAYCSLGIGAGLAAQPAISDSRAQTWAPAIAQFNSAQHEEDYVASAAAGSTTFTITAAASTWGRLIITEVSGQAVSPLDKVSTKAASEAPGAHICTATATTTQADELWHGMASDALGNAFHTFTIGGSFIVGVNVADSGSQLGGISGDYVVTSTGTAAFQFSDTATGADTFSMVTSTWKASAGGGGPTTYPQSVFGASSPAATVKRQDGKIVTASTSPLASIRRALSTKIAAACHPAATLSAIKVVLKALDAACHAVASLRRSVGKTVSASTSPVGSLVRAMATFLTALVRLRATVASEGGTRAGVGVIVPGGEGPGGPAVIVPGLEGSGGITVIVPGTGP